MQPFGSSGNLDTQKQICHTNLPRDTGYERNDTRRNSTARPGNHAH